MEWQEDLARGESAVFVVILLLVAAGVFVDVLWGKALSWRKWLQRTTVALSLAALLMAPSCAERNQSPVEQDIPYPF